MARIDNSHVISYVLVMLITLLPVASWACMVQLTPQQKMGESTAVFSGKVIDNTCKVVYGITNRSERHVTFAVQSWWKGAGTKTTTLVYARRPDSCESPSFEDGTMKIGQWWIMYVIPVKGTAYSEFPIGSDCPMSGTIPPLNSDVMQNDYRMQSYVQEVMQLGTPTHAYEVGE